MNDLEHNRDHGDETDENPHLPASYRKRLEEHEADAAVEHAHAVRGADDPECICGGGHTAHEFNAGGHSTSCPLWGQTWEGWQS